MDAPKVTATPRPLKTMEFVLWKTEKNKEQLTRDIERLGGKVVKKIHKDLSAVICGVNAYSETDRKMLEAKMYDIHVVSEDFVEEAKEFTTTPIALLKKKALCDWGSDPNERIKVTTQKSMSAKAKSSSGKSMSGKVKLTVKGGGTIDPDSGLEDCAHVSTLNTKTKIKTLRVHFANCILRFSGL